MSESRSGTATVLFTDLVGSTEMWAQLGEEGADELRRRHDEALARAVEAHGGTVVKGLGDGVMATFPGAADGVAAAVAVQQAVDRLSRRAEAELAVRIGISAGDVTFEDGDCFGEPVVEASRLCESARGGQILCSEVVQTLTRGRGGHAFAPIGTLELKGLPEPVPACEVRWAPLPPAVLPLPATLTGRAPFPFVGRREDRQVIERAWKRAEAGERVTVLLAGEPGVGKTRLAAEVAAGVRDDAGMVLAGRCDEEIGVPYQPFVEALRYFVDHCPADDLRVRLGRFGGDLARLLPDLPERVPELPGPLRSDEDTERYRLFDSVAGWLAAASGEQPVLLVLDDLHWAAKPTLLLLRHLVRSPDPMRVLVLGAYRDTDLDRSHPLAEMLADLRREASVERVSLGGLSLDEVRAFLVAAAGHELEEDARDLAAALHAETEGNPFFLEEVLAHLTETGAIYQREGRWTTDRESIEELGIPEGVREVVGRRLSRLSEGCNRVLGQAAVLGPEFDVRSVAAMTGNGEGVVEALEEAQGAGLLTEMAGASPVYAFTHALVRQTLLEELSLARRQQYHLKAAGALEGIGARPASVATHYRQAGAAADPERVVAASLAAAEEARLQLAWEEAGAHWEAALDVLDVYGGEPAEKARLLELLGDAMFATGRDWERGIDQLERARELYEGLGDAYRAAKVRSRIGRNLSTFPGRTDLPRAHANLELAEVVLREGPETAALGYLLVGVAQAHFAGARSQEGAEVARRALEVGERLGNEAVEANARILLGGHLGSLGRVAEGLRHIEEGYEQAVSLGQPILAWVGAAVRTAASGNLADPKDVEAWADRELASGRHDQAPGLRVLLLQQKAYALLDQGRLAEVRRLAAEVPLGAAGGYLLWCEGDWGGAEQWLRDELERDRRAGFTWVVFNAPRRLGLLRALQRRFEEAVASYEDALAALGPAGQMDARAWVHAEIAVALAGLGRLGEARAHTETCRGLLLPGEDYRGLGGYVALAEAVVTPDEAEARFTSALQTFQGLHLPWFEAQAFEEWGRKTRRPELLDRALDIYERIGAGQAWLDRARRIRAEIASGP